jgi:Zn-dependent protease
LLRKERYFNVPQKDLSLKEFSYGPSLHSKTKNHRFSSIELMHLTLGSLMMVAVGLSFIPQQTGFWLEASLLFTSVFLFHELAHKIVAEHYGLWAEFRLKIFGVFITVLSIFLPVKIVMPGAVMISGEINKKFVGLTALAGPLTNLVLSCVFFLLYMSLGNSFSSIFLFGFFISSWISLFNLIPFGTTDGVKILFWNKKLWTISFLASLTLTLVAMVFLM